MPSLIMTSLAIFFTLSKPQCLWRNLRSLCKVCEYNFYLKTARLIVTRKTPDLKKKNGLSIAKVNSEVMG